MATVPPSSALAPARWHTSRPTSAVIGAIVSRPIKPQRGLHLLIGDDVQKRRLAQLQSERFAQRVVEHGVAGAIDHRRQHDGVLRGQRRCRRSIDTTRSRRPPPPSTVARRPGPACARRPRRGGRRRDWPPAERFSAPAPSAPWRRPDLNGAGSGRNCRRGDHLSADGSGRSGSSARFSRFRSARNSAALW